MVGEFIKREFRNDSNMDSNVPVPIPEPNAAPSKEMTGVTQYIVPKGYSNTR